MTLLFIVTLMGIYSAVMAVMTGSYILAALYVLCAIIWGRWTTQAAIKLDRLMTERESDKI
jgi:tetrahydromethanopterin S-methyltransferase subunit C